MKEGPLRILGLLVLTTACAAVLPGTAGAQVKLAAGRLTGVVGDSSGTPQMGASVEVVPLLGGTAAPFDFLTNSKGIFRSDRLPPGLYTVRVTLAGFLPTLQRIRIDANLTTMIRVQLESMFASLDELRQHPAAANSAPDDWKWVLRSGSGMRPVLQWNKGGIETAALSGEGRAARSPRMILQVTDGARRPGSVSNVASAPGTAFAYDQKMGSVSRLLIAGQVSYQDQASGGISTVWLPSGMLEAGPHTALVLREAKLGPNGPTFRGARIDQGGTVALGDRAVLQYGGEFVFVGLGTAASSLRPHLKMQARVNDVWRTALIFASQPAGLSPLDAAGPGSKEEPALSKALDELDAFPALMWRNGHPVLESGWHEEVSAERKLGNNGMLQVAAFHDDSHHTAVFGRGRDLLAADFFQDAFSNGFAYDGGAASSWGGRVALRENLRRDFEFTAVYALAGALAPVGPDDGILRDSLDVVPRHSLGADVSARLSGLGTRVTAGYKWIDGTAVSPVDAYGESLYQMDPYLHVGVRQQLPKFAPGHWEAMADCDNLLAQGYVVLNTSEGRVTLVPVFRTFRGGVSVQF